MFRFSIIFVIVFFVFHSCGVVNNLINEKNEPFLERSKINYHINTNLNVDIRNNDTLDGIVDNKIRFKDTLKTSQQVLDSVDKLSTDTLIDTKNKDSVLISKPIGWQIKNIDTPNNIINMVNLIKVDSAIQKEELLIKDSLVFGFILKWLYTPYAYGKQDRWGVDCSALVQHFYKHSYDTIIARTSTEQYHQLKNVDSSQVQMGDVIFFNTSDNIDIKDKVTHSGIYLTKNFFFHASSSQGVKIDYLAQDYWQKRLQGIKGIRKDTITTTMPIIDTMLQLKPIKDSLQNIIK